MNSRRSSPMKRGKPIMHNSLTKGGSSQKLFTDTKQCLLTDFTVKEIKESQLMTSEVCYHKIYEDLINQINDVNSQIQKEINDSQKELKDVVQYLINMDSLGLANQSQLMKLKNNLNLNIILGSNDQKPPSIIKEEIKDTVIEKLQKNCIPNFCNDIKVTPFYQRFIPQDPNQLTKSWLTSGGNMTLDNSYVSKLEMPEELTKKAFDAASTIQQASMFYTILDFKPINSEFLLLSRLDFMTKQNKVYNYLRNQLRERSYEIQMNQNIFRNLQQQWLNKVEIDKRNTDKMLKQKYPQIYDDFEFEQKTHPGILSSEQFGYHSLQGAIGSGFPKTQFQQPEEEEWDDFQRYRDNNVQIPRYKFCLYDIKVDYEQYPQIITNPQEYEQEYKRKSVWSLKDIETFLKVLLENPKNFWVIGKTMTHKTSKELIFFYQTFKKLFNLKKHFKTCFVLMSLPTQNVKKQAIQDIINDIMKPIQKYQYETKGQTQQWDMNQATATNFTGPNQIYFTLDQLLKIYTQTSECRRKFKEQEKEITKFNKNINPFKTFAIPKYKQIESTFLKENQYYKEIEERGKVIYDKFQEKVKQELPENPEQQKNCSQFVQKSALNAVIFLNYQNQMPQNLIKTSIQGQSQKEEILKKRKFSEFYMTNNFGSGSGRNINKWVLLKQNYLQDDHSQTKRLKFSQSSSALQPYIKAESFTQKYFGQTNNLLPQLQTLQYFKSNVEESKDSTKDILMLEDSKQKGLIEMDIKNEFSNEKEYAQYMEGRFRQIFIERSQDNSNDIDESSQFKRKGCLQWQDDEKELFVTLLKKHGRDWQSIADELPRKTDKQCRNYFQNYKHKYNLIQFLPEKHR